MKRIATNLGFRVPSSALICAAVIGIAQPAVAAQYLTDDAEAVSSTADIATIGPWSEIDGDVSVSSAYAHSGRQSYRLSYAANEAQSYLGFKLSTPVRRVFVRWWELRERAGDFAGAKDFDWSAEKTIRIRSLVIGTTGVDYPLGWGASTGLRGTSGTDGPGDMVIFGNSSASNGADLVTARPAGISRGVWFLVEVEVDLGTRGNNDGNVRLWVNDVLLGERTNVNLLPSTDATIGEIWVGGWYSGLSPNPSPANRYVDDIVISSQKVGLAGSLQPNSPGNFLVR